MPTHPEPALRPGDPVVFVDRQGRQRYDVLEPGRVSNVRGNLLDNDLLIGQPEGCLARSDRGPLFHVFRATLRQHVLNMTRHAQIVYPKDLAMLVAWADIRPGDVVIEGGLGSGGLTVALLRAVGPTGRVVSYELHAESANLAAKNVHALFGAAPPHHEARVADIYEGIAERDVDRVVLDVPEPWEAAPHARDALRLGGVLAAYVPTAIQLQKLGCALERDRAWRTIEHLETILRPWVASGRSVRPETKIIGHTGFLVFARKGARP